LRAITDIQIGLLQHRLAERHLTLELSDEARDWLAAEGFDPAYGARPLKRLVQREIGDRLALAILEGRVNDGDTVTVTVGGDGLTVR
jgi:ATP-dependent Clp protease ATP-binding subunit ClpB